MSLPKKARKAKKLRDSDQASWRWSRSAPPLPGVYWYKDKYSVRGAALVEIRQYRMLSRDNKEIMDFLFPHIMTDQFGTTNSLVPGLIHQDKLKQLYKDGGQWSYDIFPPK